MAYVREGLSAYVRESFQRKLENPFARFRPWLSFLSLVSVERLTKLGRPNTAAGFGDLSGLGRGELRRLGHGTGMHFNFVKYEPNDGATLSHRGSTPVATVFGEDNAGMMETRWSHYVEPMRIGKSSLDDATGPSAIMSIMDNTTSITMERLLKRGNDDLLSGTLTAAEQNLVRWPNLLGVTHLLTADNTYGRVDREVETSLNPVVIDASDTAVLADRLIDLDLIDKINHGNGAIVGRAQKSADGQGCNLHVVHPKLWQVLRVEAQGMYAIQIPGSPTNAAVGAKRPAIRYGDNWITYDDDLPQTEMYSTRIEAWILEVDPRYNFVPQKFVLKSDVEEGGEFYEWSNIHAKLRLTNRQPWLNVRTTNLQIT